MADNLKTIKQALETDGVYTGLTKGNSMEPLIHHQQDNIIVVRPNGRLKKYDVAVYITKRGKYIMHRVVKVFPDHYVIIGDNRLEKEYVTDDMVIGVLKGFYKGGKRYIDLEKVRLIKPILASGLLFIRFVRCFAFAIKQCTKSKEF